MNAFVGVTLNFMNNSNKNRLLCYGDRVYAYVYSTYYGLIYRDMSRYVLRLYSCKLPCFLRS